MILLLLCSLFLMRGTWGSLLLHQGWNWNLGIGRWGTNHWTAGGSPWLCLSAFSSFSNSLALKICLERFPRPVLEGNGVKDLFINSHHLWSFIEICSVKVPVDLAPLLKLVWRFTFSLPALLPCSMESGNCWCMWFSGNRDREMEVAAVSTQGKGTHCTEKWERRSLCFRVWVESSLCIVIKRKVFQATMHFIVAWIEMSGNQPWGTSICPGRRASTLPLFLTA